MQSGRRAEQSSCHQERWGQVTGIQISVGCIQGGRWQCNLPKASWRQLISTWKTPLTAEINHHRARRRGTKILFGRGILESALMWVFFARNLPPSYWIWILLAHWSRLLSPVYLLLSREKRREHMGRAVPKADPEAEPSISSELILVQKFKLEDRV